MYRVQVIAALLFFSMAIPAYGYNPMTSDNCEEIWLSSAPRVIVHISEIEELDFVMYLQILAAIDAVNSQVNLVGSTSAAITQLITSEDPFVFTDWYGDTTPTVHVGFSSDVTIFEEFDNAVALTSHSPLTDCIYSEAHIVFQNTAPVSWRYLTPSSYGELFYDLSNYPYMTEEHSLYFSFRAVYLHELLHAFGLSHTTDSYAFMNYGVRPWANRETNAQVRPLPDDIEGLRHLYPGVTTRREIGVFNTWYDSTDISDSDAAYQKYLCIPSTGDTWADKFNDDACGLVTTKTGTKNGSRTVRAGDILRTQVAVGNYGTQDLEVSHYLLFSKDDKLSLLDGLSPTHYVYNLGDASSARKGLTFRVPSLSPGLYYTIVSVVGRSSDGLMTTDWIPLREYVVVEP